MPGRPNENTPGFGDALLQIPDMFAAALRGTTKATLGLPGSIEHLFPNRPGYKYIFPTTEEVSDWLPPLHRGMPNEPEHPYEKLASYVPLTPGQVGELGGSLLGQAAKSQALRSPGWMGAVASLGDDAAIAASRVFGGEKEKAPLPVRQPRIFANVE